MPLCHHAPCPMPHPFPPVPPARAAEHFSKESHIPRQPTGTRRARVKPPSPPKFDPTYGRRIRHDGLGVHDFGNRSRCVSPANLGKSAASPSGAYSTALEEQREKKGGREGPARSERKNVRAGRACARGARLRPHGSTAPAMGKGHGDGGHEGECTCEPMNQ